MSGVGWALLIVGSVVGTLVFLTCAIHFLHVDEWEASGCPWPFHCYYRDGAK